MTKEHTPYAHQHPIHNSLAFHINTPMIDELHGTITRWLWCGSTGGQIIGGARTGKSHAITAIAERLETRAGEPIASVYLSIPKRDVSTIAGVFRSICNKLELKTKRAATADIMSYTIAHRLAEMSLCNANRQIVLFVDEFQRLSIHQLGAFVELYDDLRAMGTSLTVLFIGNAGETTRLLEAIQLDANEHIRGRFFIDGCRFSGLRHRQDVEACLRRYDSDRFPLKTGPTVTEFFLPKQFKAGWRLAQISHLLWHVYSRRYQGPLKLSSWAMRYFTATVALLLSDYLPTLSDFDDDVIQAMVDESIKASGLVPGLVSVSS